MGSRKVRNLEKHVTASIDLRVLSTNADHFMPPETCDMPPEAEALSHMSEVTEDDFDALCIRTS